ncbi:MAG: Mur ligase family protein [Campylobacterota bacterium]
MKNIEQFLQSKAIFYKDFEFETVQKAFARIKQKIQPKKVIHIVGTNGKGSTGRALAHMLHKSGHSVVHYSSPHIHSFNERIWVDGSDIDFALLQRCHEELTALLGKLALKLSYFEYGTLLALICAKSCDYLVLEAGLGGEFDATNVITSDITVATAIGYDHQEFLGDTIERIATTKLRACDKLLIVAKQQYSQVYEIANKVCVNTIKVKYDENFFIRGFLGENIQTAIAVLKQLHLGFDKRLLNGLHLKARAQRIASNIMIDVGHNPLAAAALKPLLKKDTILIYNSVKDKDIKGVLQILRPKIKQVERLEVDNERIVSKDVLQGICKELQLPFCEHKGIENDQNYLVFGSFFTVEQFLKSYKEFEIDGKE